MVVSYSFVVGGVAKRWISRFVSVARKVWRVAYSSTSIPLVNRESIKKKPGHGEPGFPRDGVAQQGEGRVSAAPVIKTAIGETGSNKQNRNAP
jgi:hypothetical protein